MCLIGIHVDEIPQVLFPNLNNVQCIIPQDIRLQLKMKRTPCISTNKRTHDKWSNQSQSSKIDNDKSRWSEFYKLHQRKGTINPENLVARWRIGIASARLTLKSTSQEHTLSSDNLPCHFKTGRVHARYHTLHGSYTKFYMTTLFSQILYLRGNICGRIYFNRASFYKFYPLKSRKDAHTTFLPLVKLTGISSSLHSDRDPKLTTGISGSILQKYRICRPTIESKSQW